MGLSFFLVCLVGLLGVLGVDGIDELLVRCEVAQRMVVKAQDKAVRLAAGRNDLVREALDAGVGVGELSSRLGVSRQRVYQIADVKW